MRKLDLSSYKIKETGDPEAQEHDYDVRWSIGEVLLCRDQNLSARELLANDDLYRKLQDCPDESILLEEAEYQVIRQAFERLSGFQRYDVPLVRRVLEETPEVEVQEKPSANGVEGQGALSASHP